MTLRRKLTWLVTLIVILLLSTNMIFSSYENRRLMSISLQRRLDTIGTTVGLMVLPVLVVSGGDIDAKLADVAAVFRKTVENHDDIREISLFDQSRKLLLVYPLSSNVSNSDKYVETIIPLRLTADGRDYGYLKVVFDLSSYYTSQQWIMLRQILLGIIFALAGWSASWLLAAKTLKPVESLRDAAVKFGSGNYKARTDVHSADELGLLSKTFNEMASRLENQINIITQLQEWGRIVTSELAREKVIQLTVQAFTEMGGVSKMSLMLWNEDAEYLEIVGGIGLRADAASFMRLKIGEGVAGKVLETGKPIRIESIDSSSEYKSYSGASHGSMLALPLIAKSRCFGVVNLHEKKDASAFSEEDVSILTTLAEISSVAFENARLYDLAITDGLTKLFIARYFHQRMEEEIVRTKRTGNPISLMMADLDHFKNINDTYGHQVGDAVLVIFARIIRKVFREIDIPCRYGGEEFTIILPNTDKVGSLIVAERFRKAVEEFVFRTSAGDLHITVSIGLSTYKLGMTKDEMINASDEALYNSKRMGRNKSTHFLDMR